MVQLSTNNKKSYSTLPRSIFVSFVIGVMVLIIIAINYPNHFDFQKKINYQETKLETKKELTFTHNLHFVNKDQNVPMVQVILVATNKERSLGLSIVDHLDNDEGMWFVFEQNGNYPFWMKEMQFPIDIVWIDENYRIVDFYKNALPEDYPKTYIPRDISRYVLELQAGFVDDYQIAIGDSVVIKGK